MLIEDGFAGLGRGDGAPEAVGLVQRSDGAGPQGSLEESPSTLADTSQGGDVAFHGILLSDPPWLRQQLLGYPPSDVSSNRPRSFKSRTRAAIGLSTCWHFCGSAVKTLP